jgi:hypothetical protein
LPIPFIGFCLGGDLLGGQCDGLGKVVGLRLVREDELRLSTPVETKMNRFLLAAPNAPRRKERLRRLDRIAGELNGLLAVFAIGLATLGLTRLIGHTSSIDCRR